VLLNRQPVLRGVFVPAGSLSTPATTALLRPNGRVLIFGGTVAAENGFGSLGATPESVLLYDPAAGESREIGTTSGSVSFAVPLADGRVLAIELAPPPVASGGMGGNSTASLIDPERGIVAALGPISRVGVSGAGVRLTDGRVLLVGDIDGSTRAELFDPATGTVSTTGSTSRPMAHPTATLLTDGRVLVVDEREPVAELYDPATGTFSRTGAMARPHEDFTATLLMDGRVLIAGGWDTNGSVVDGVFFTSEPARLATVAEIFDPASGSFTQIGPMVAARVYHFAVGLGDGRVLIGGGSSSTRSDAGSGGIVEPIAFIAELFDPRTGTFVPTGALATPRYGAGAILLPDGRVLVIGSTHPAGTGIATDAFAASSMEVFE